MSNLEELWQKQLEFTTDVLAKTRDLDINDISEKNLVSISEKYLLSLHKELDEVLDGLNWKEHRSLMMPTVRENLIEEMIDVQKYLWGLMQIWGMSAVDFIQAFDDKSFVVDKRWQMEQAVLGDKVAVVDIDGVLYNEAETFKDWIERARPYMKEASKRDNALAWEEAKWEFRTSQQHRWGSAFKENVDALRRMKYEEGWSIVLMTYRPKKVFSTIEYDTLFWLDNNEVPYDKLIWAAYEKYFYMREEMRNADIFIDDELETCRLVQSLGKRVYWVYPNEDEIPEALYHDVGPNPIICIESLSQVESIEKERCLYI